MTWFEPTPESPTPYWAEDACYAFTSQQIADLRQSAAQLTSLVLEAIDHAITWGKLSQLGIPAFLHPAIRDSWDRDDPCVYMRLDLAYDGLHPPQLLEVNGQTPTSLIEAAIAQWHWLEDRLSAGLLPPEPTQWNTIHEGLLEQWSYIKARGVERVHFSSAALDEDMATVTYLRDLAQEAGIGSSYLTVEQLGVSGDAAHLLDPFGWPIKQLMWLWPFEFAWESPEAHTLASTQTRFIEPLWKAVTSSKGLLALLHDLFPEHPLVLLASLEPGRLGGRVVSKPLYSREGQNVALPGQPPTPGDYSDLPRLEQRYTELPTFPPDGPRYPVLGVWVAGDEVCGLGVREGQGRVTDNRASFVPHVVTT